ncbi:hypothetical protein ONZ45_g2817 [Pleurotus djamor]|nr:hypothetical protein ONZ45_g2817 [Pleurotus djamor]
MGNLSCNPHSPFLPLVSLLPRSLHTELRSDQRPSTLISSSSSSVISRHLPPFPTIRNTRNFSQVPDEDFLALLQKEFPHGGAYDFNGINPQSILNYPLPTLTPPSEDSSPSPPSAHDESSNSPNADNDDNPESALKRKASDEDFEAGPSSKSQHTSSNKKASSSTTTRRKSSGTAPPKEESKLLKRKEQNRAAQRAFRERKEKHVKDLEDKVAALEAKNEATQTENDNLKDLLSRLQTENVLLKSATFTFSMPKSVEGAQFTQSPTTDNSVNMFNTTSPSAPSPSETASSSTSPKTNYLSSIDWNALTPFDSSMLSALDDTPQSAISSNSMNMDFSMPGNAGPSLSSYTTIANNPSFMSFASMFDSTSTPPNPEPTPFTYDMSSVMSTWSPPPSTDSNSLDDLFGNMLGTPQPPVDFNVLMTTSPSPSLSPISHHNSTGRSPADTSSASSPSSNPSPSDKPDLSQHQDCPKTKAEIEQAIKVDSPFAPPSGKNATSDSPFASCLVNKGNETPTVACHGSGFPKIEKSDQNIEVLSAWKTIRSNPQFKDVDINDLCSQFTNKARCDGTKVVLDPQGVHNIIESLKNKGH